MPPRPLADESDTFLSSLWDPLFKKILLVKEESEVTFHLFIMGFYLDHIRRGGGQQWVSPVWKPCIALQNARLFGFIGAFIQRCPRDLIFCPLSFVEQCDVTVGFFIGGTMGRGYNGVCGPPGAGIGRQ